MGFLANFIMKNRMQAMMVASSMALLSIYFPPISIVSSATVALVTLRRGAVEGLYVLLCAGFAAALLSMIVQIGYQFVVLYGLLLWAPIWLIAIILREGRHLSVAIEIAVGLGALFVIGFYLYQPQPAAFWHELLMAMMQPMIEAGQQMDVDGEQVRQSIDLFSRYMTGAIAAGSVFGLLFGLFLGRWWQSLLYNPGGFRHEFLSLRLHVAIGYATLLVLVVAFFATGMVAELLANIALLAFVLYTLVGTAALHASFSQMKASRFMVPFLYVTLMMIPHVMVLVALLGLADHWLNLRNQIKLNGA